MVAQIRAEVFHHMLCTPDRDPFDSEGVQLAVETARGLEGEGDFAGAAQWLRRAVREAEKQGNIARAESLTRAAEALAEKVDPWDETSLAASSAAISDAIDDNWVPVDRATVAVAPFAKFPAPRAERSAAAPTPPAPTSIPPLLAALISSMPPFSNRASVAIPRPPANPSHLTPFASSPPAAPAQSWSQDPPIDAWPDAASASAANDDIVGSTAARPTRSMVVAKHVHAAEASAPSAPASEAVGERPFRVSAFRAAIPVSGEHTHSFLIQRLASGQRAPAGMVEAMIVVTGESEGTISFEASLGVAKRTG